MLTLEDINEAVCLLITYSGTTCTTFNRVGTLESDNVPTS